MTYYCYERGSVSLYVICEAKTFFTQFRDLLYEIEDGHSVSYRREEACSVGAI